MIVVRPAAPEDEAAIERVSASGVAALRETYRPNDDAIASKPHSLPRLVAVCDGELVGTVEYLLREDRLHLMGLYVLASHRRRGVGRALVDALHDLAGARKLSLRTIRETGNVPIFERLGFAVVEERRARHFIGAHQEVVHEAFLEYRDV